jgi:predicted  nucleic acid-binding Zn-ribbon protein
MAYIRNRYQRQLDQDMSDIVRRTWDLESTFRDIHGTRNEAERLNQDIKKHFEERDRIYTNLENILGREEGYEKEMLSRTLEGMKAGGNITVKQRMKDVDIDTVQYGSIEQYKRLYPRYGEEVFRNVNEFKQKEREIRYTQEMYNRAVARFNTLLENARDGLLKDEENFAKYERTKAEGEKELTSCRYYNSIFYRMASKKTKVELSLDTLKHNIEKFKHSFQVMRDEYSSYKARPLDLMQY